MHLFLLSLFFFFNDTATTEIYTLSLHDALPILAVNDPKYNALVDQAIRYFIKAKHPELGEQVAREAIARDPRSEEHTSELQSPDHLVCRLLLEKKKKYEIIYRTTTNTRHQSHQY